MVAMAAMVELRSFEDSFVFHFGGVNLMAILRVVERGTGQGSKRSPKQPGCCAQAGIAHSPAEREEPSRCPTLPLVSSSCLNTKPSKLDMLVLFSM